MTSILAVLSLLAAPDVAPLVLKGGTEIALDGKVAPGEWDDAVRLEADHPFGGRVRLFLKRNGPWLALAVDGDRPYAGEMLWLFVRDDTRAWACHMTFGLGQPAHPPLLWKRAPPDALANPEFGPGECPRAARVRVDVGRDDGWAAEFLVRLSALGIGQRDLREFAAMLRLAFVDFDQMRTLVTVPEGERSPQDLEGYAPLVSPDGWGAGETWAPVSPEVSQEFDDHELLHRLFLEHEALSLRTAPDKLAIARAVQPRSGTRIDALRREMEAGRQRNPTLPQWTYFLGRLLHEANLFDEAGRLLEEVPAPLRSLDPFVNLMAEHYLDTEQWQRCLDVCAAYPLARGMRETIGFATAAQQAWARELIALAKDKRKETPHPRIRIVTERGDIECELFEDDAPLAVRNFMDLFKRGFYDQLRFGEVGGGTVATLGDPSTRPDGGEADAPPWRLRVEQSTRPLLRGYLATVPMPAGAYHGSKFMMAVAPLMRENDRVTVFGRVLEGLEVLERLDQDDLCVRIEVLSKRNHAYDPLAARLEQ